MSTELVEEAEEAKEIFANRYDRWDAFIQLAPEKEAVCEAWNQALLEELRSRCAAEAKAPKAPGWLSEMTGDGSACWYLEGCNREKSVLLLWGERNNLSRYELSIYDFGKSGDSGIRNTKDLLGKERFIALKSGFETPPFCNRDGSWILAQGNDGYCFEGWSDRFYEPDKLAWFAGNRTKEFADQIIARVDRFRGNPNLTKLLGKLNEEIIQGHPI